MQSICVEAIGGFQLAGFSSLGNHAAIDDTFGTLQSDGRWHLTAVTLAFQFSLQALIVLDDLKVSFTFLLHRVFHLHQLFVFSSQNENVFLYLPKRDINVTVSYLLSIGLDRLLFFLCSIITPLQNDNIVIETVHLLFFLQCHVLCTGHLLDRAPNFLLFLLLPGHLLLEFSDFVFGPYTQITMIEPSQLLYPLATYV